MYSLILAIFSLFYFAFPSPLQSQENWLLDEDDTGFYVILPIRLNDQSVGGVEVKQITVYDGDTPVNDFRFQIDSDGQSFNFTKTDIERFYLRYFRTHFSPTKEIPYWPCEENFFHARVKNSDEAVNNDYEGLRRARPTQTGFNARYVHETAVLGKTKIDERFRPVEVWGFANSAENAERMRAFYEKRLIDSTYHHFGSTKKNYSGKSRILSDSVSINFRYSSEYTQADSSRLRAADFHMNLAVNGDTKRWTEESRESSRWVGSGRGSTREKEWSWTDPGYHHTKLDDRSVSAHIKSEGADWRIWVQYKGSGDPKQDLNVVNVRVPKCE